MEALSKGVNTTPSSPSVEKHIYPRSLHHLTLDIATMADPPPTPTELSIRNQNTSILWFHHCYVGCESSWHITPQSPDITYILSSFEDDLFADTSTLNAKDVKIWRLDLLSNSDGDETKGSQK